MATTMVAQTVDEIHADQSKLDSAFNRVLDWIPYVTLCTSVVLSLALSDRSAGYDLVTVGIAVAAAVWVYAAYTRLRSQREAAPARFAVYVFVMLAFGAVLMSRDMLFFVFVITGFFHSGLLRPLPLMVVGVAASSIVIDSTILGPEVTVEKVVIFVVIVVVQTLAVSGGYVLSAKVDRLVKQRHEAVEAREAALEENAGLHMQLLTQAREAGVLDERQRLAREIHDTVAQGLAGIIAQLHAADGSDDELQRRRHLDSAADLARDSLTEARRTVRAIGPSTLETAQLPEALAEVAAKWSRSQGVPAELVTTGEARPMHPEVEVTLLRIAQEALTNVGKHAEAGRVGLTLSYMEDQLALDVRDDGRGFEPARTKTAGGTGYGLSAMRQRVNRLAGSLSIESEPGSGTVVSAAVPVIPRVVADAR
ncbi:sensor histidine kinase [Glycomyces tarimensis]